MIYFCTGALFQCVSYLRSKSNNALITWDIRDDPTHLTLASCHSAVEGFNCSISHTDHTPSHNDHGTSYNAKAHPTISLPRHIFP
jgi:hypothetical protein